MRHLHDMPFGATLRAGGGACFRLWAPAATQVDLMLGDMAALPARVLPGGWYEVEQPEAQAGQRYRWRIDGSGVVPDPAARCSPEGPHAASELFDPLAFAWDDDGWAGRPWHHAVFYQLHVGAFSHEGNYAAVAKRLPALRELGITAIQLMPLGDFPGRFGWGYDGVLPFAPFHGYGRPDELKALVQTAHRLGLMVFGDVVYNHFGPEGNHLRAYAPQFFSTRHGTAWGPAINYDGDGADTVREFFIANALYWLNEFRFDGLRLDAVHAIRDDRRPDILEELSQRVRAACRGRHVHLVLENDANEARRLAAPATPGRYDGQWSGDVHHALHVLLTDEHDGYYADYDDPVPQLGRSLAHGYSREAAPHDGDGPAPRRAAQGSAPLGAIVDLLQNHDQIGNRAFGERLLRLAEPAAVRLAAAIVILSPSVPLLFMGEEYGATTPFLYFADWHGELRDAVRKGRREEFAHFPRDAQAAREGRLPDPCSAQTFASCVLEAPAADDAHAQGWLEFHRALLRCRNEALRPWLPRLQPQGHRARHHGRLLQLDWLFEAAEPAAAPRALRMQVNLSGQAIDAAATVLDDAPAGSEPVYRIGAAEGTQLGAWSGRWFWLAADLAR